MADVFISYHEASAGELAEQIADALDAVGISCWCARRNMPPGADFARSIPVQINACKLFLLILNEKVYHSAHIESEVGIAFSRWNRGEDIRVLPIEVGDFVREGWVEYYLIHEQSVKFPAQPDEQHMQSLVGRIAKLLGRMPSQKMKPPLSKPDLPPQKIAQRGQCGDNVTYTLDENGVLAIAGSGSMDDYVYDKKINGINTPWYSARQIISRAEIRNGITSIGDGAFFDCSALTSVTIPDSVTSIHDMAFYRCSALTSVTIPESVTSIGVFAFAFCALTNVSVPADTQISYNAFPDTTRITLRHSKRPKSGRSDD